MSCRRNSAANFFIFFRRVNENFLPYERVASSNKTTEREYGPKVAKAKISAR
jgi:hypothetical protein